MTQGKIRKWLALFMMFALVASACGSDSEEGEGDTEAESEGNIIDEDTKEAAEEALSGDDDGEGDGDAASTADIGSVEDWEALWAEERAALVATIEENGWGWDQEANTLVGPDFEVDLSACPEGWDPYEGLEDGTIKIGQTIAQSGTLADYGNIAVGQQVYYDYVNEQGGITDSEGNTYSLQSDARDDAYDVAKTVPLVDELLDSEGSFMIQSLGSPNTMKVYDKLNARCVPQPYVMTGHPAWGDPENHPWTWGHQLAYNTEAILWGGLIAETFADQDEITVAALIMQNDFGAAYELGFETYAAGSDKTINFEFERIEPTAPTITNQMTTLASKDPDVFIAMVAGAPCTQAITEAANNGMKEAGTMLIQPSVCKALSFVGAEAVGDDGSATDGWWIIGGGAKDYNDATYADEPWIAFGRDLLEAAGTPSEGSSNLGQGYNFGWPVVQSLLVAAELPGGVSRPNFMLAARVLDMTHPGLLDGVEYNMNGVADPYPIEGSDFSIFNGTDQSWVPAENFGVIDLSGASAPCVWDQSVSNCV